MVEVLIMIALWCGQPVNSTKGSIGFKTGSEISSEQVQKCREEMIRCIDNAKRVATLSTLAMECAMGHKLP